ncbi:MAG: hypothetical protein Q9174_005839 [Haloplaca sp. 1 TL-2023]
MRIVFFKDTVLVMWLSSSPYAIWYCIQTSIPPIYKDFYGFSELYVGVTYLSGATGVIMGSYLNGKMMDRNYKITARETGFTIDKHSGDNLNDFPIEKARARGSYYLLVIYACALAAYGWVVSLHIHESLPLILQFVLGMLCTSFQQTYNALLVDVFPSNPSTAAAAANLVKCALSAAAVAVLQPLETAVGIGWVFTILTILSAGGGFVSLWALRKYGMKWRQRRKPNTAASTEPVVEEVKCVT